MTIKVHNPLGQLVYSNSIQSINSNFYTYNLNKLDSGLYFINLETINKAILLKLF